MNELSRIYQGRVIGMVLQTKVTESPWQEIATEKIEGLLSDCPLWSHHETFQGAINYYLIALAAMVNPEGRSLLLPFRKQVERCWDEVSHRAGQSFTPLSRSVGRYLDLGENPEIEDAFASILKGNETSVEVLDAAVSNLADQLATGKGGGNVQKLGRGELPKFCSPSSTANFLRDPLIQKRSYHQKLLPWLLYHGEGLSSSSPELKQFDVYSIATPNKKSPKKKGSEAKKLLTAAINELENIFPEHKKQFESLSKRLEKIGEESLEIQNYVGSSAKGAVKARLFALLIFNYLEKSEFTLLLLRETHKEPSNKKPDPVVIDETRMDPLEQSRGERGFVFPAFTALPAWEPKGQGEPVWTEFDIAAFKEALKTLNQFRQKTEERKNLRVCGENLEQWILEKDEKALQNSVDASLGKDAPESEEGERPFTFAGDDRIELIRELVSELHASQEENLPPLYANQVDGGCPETGGSDGNRTKSYRIFYGTLRGFYDLRDTWNSICKSPKSRNSEPSEAELKEAVKELQRRDRYGIGSAPLFLRLCEKKYWPIWLERTSEEEGKRVENFWAKSPLHAWAEYGNLREEIERLSEPIRFTPAEPKCSRRLSMLSDYSGRSKTKFGIDDEKRAFVECSLAVREEGSRLEQRRARLYYAAKRMRRDGIPMDVAENERRWIQPMVEAFQFTLPTEKALKKVPAVALMPQFGRTNRKDSVRMLLNFPVQIEPGWLVENIAKTRWPDTEKSGRALEIAAQWMGWTNYGNHIHWGKEAEETGTFKPAKAKGFPSEPFHEEPEIQKHGFSVLSFDLGQRSAGGYAVLESRCDNEKLYRNRRPDWTIGIDSSGREWKTAAIDFGIFRLPGEDAKVFRPKSKKDSDDRAGKAFRTELFGEAGRNASHEEWQEACAIAGRLGISPQQAVEEWLGKTESEFSFPEQNDKLILIFRRAQSRLASWQRWSWKLSSEDSEGAGLDEIKNTFAKSKDASLDDVETAWSVLAKDGKVEELRKSICDAVWELKETLRKEIVNLANRILPLRNSSWLLREREGESRYIELVQDGTGAGEVRKIRGQRGLSLKRISQLEDFRKRVLSLNRSNGHSPGERPLFGKRGLAPEPCRDVLERIDRLKEQRINQSAHLILAKALGVELTAPSKGKDLRYRLDIHGEYQRIQGRKPVDLIVIEDLHRYTSFQGRSRRENSQLMKWCHRAIRDKLVELCEPFGIPILEVQPAYSSKFHARTGHAGFRAEEIQSLPTEHFIKKNLKVKTTGEKGVSDDDRNLNLAYQLLDKLQERLESQGKFESKHQRSLIVPRDGGPLFLSAKQKAGGAFQADVNAAINLGLSGICKHDNLRIIRKIRATRKGDTFVPRRDNLREKATFTKGAVISPQDVRGLDEGLTKRLQLNFFVDTGALTSSDRVEIKDVTEPIVSARALLGEVKRQRWKRCWEENFTRIRKNNWLSESDITRWEREVNYDDEIPI